MADLGYEPTGQRILNDLADFAKRVPSLSGGMYHRLDDGRLITIKIDPPLLDEATDAKGVSEA